MARKKILHVDDDEAILRTVGRFLEGHGFAVTTTTSPFIAPIIQKEQPDLIIMDVEMPLLNGDRIIDILRGHEFTGIPVIFFSGKPSAALTTITSRNASSSYVEKKSGLPALLERITRVL